MSEEIKQEDNKQEDRSFIEIAKEAKLEQFKSASDLAKAYKELQKAFSSRKPSKGDSEESTIQKFQDYFEGANIGESSLGGDLGDIAKDLIKGHKLPGKLADGVVSQAAGKVADLVTSKNRKGITKLLSDAGKREAIERALGTDEAIKDFTKRYHQGIATVQEAKLLAKMGTTSSENTKGVDIDSRGEISKESKSTHLMGILQDPGHPYYNELSPLHADAVKEVNKLKKELNF